jgi:hypothetical protein
MFIHLIEHKERDSDESGFVLVLAIVSLLVLTLLGIWALNTSDFELKVAGGSQQVERQFNLAEGAAYAEAGKVGFFLQPFYMLPDPSLSNWGMLLIPTTDAAFDPGNDTATTLAGITLIDPASWPWQNLLNDNTASANEFDYRSLVTYLGYENAMGSSAEYFSAYNFRVQGAAPLVVELGGTKLGPKASM